MSSGFRIPSSVSRLQKQHFNAMFIEWDFFLQPLKVVIQAFVLAVDFVTRSLVMKNSLHLLTIRSIEVFSKQNHRRKVKPQVFFPKVSDYFNSVFQRNPALMRKAFLWSLHDLIVSPVNENSNDLLFLSWLHG